MTLLGHVIPMEGGNSATDAIQECVLSMLPPTVVRLSETKAIPDSLAVISHTALSELESKSSEQLLEKVLIVALVYFAVFYKNQDNTKHSGVHCACHLREQERVVSTTTRKPTSSFNNSICTSVALTANPWVQAIVPYRTRIGLQASLITKWWPSLKIFLHLTTYMYTANKCWRKHYVVATQ